MGEPVPYAVGGVAVAPGPRKQVKLPARVFRGRLTGLLFETDKTFLLPASLKGIKGLRSFFDQHPNLQVLVVGHTDTVGSAQYNLTLSMERAKSIAAYLTDDADFWMEFYAGRQGSHPWGVREDQHMLSELSDGGEPFYTGPIDGNASSSRDAVKRFQELSNQKRGTSLKEDGNAGQKTRKEMVLAYMQIPGTTLPEGTVLKTHGCGEFHLEKPTPDDTPEQENRRVEVFFFEGMIDPPPRDRCPSPGCPEQPEWVKKSMHTFDLSQDPGSLTVRTEDENGAPVGKSQVHIAGPTLADDASGDDGVVVFKDLIPGHYSILARKEGLENGTAEVEVAPAGGGAAAKEPPAGSKATVTLQAGAGKLEVTVLDDGGKPLDGVEVRVQPPAPAAEVGPKTTANQKPAEFEKVPAGSCEVLLKKKGFKDAKGTASVVGGSSVSIKVAMAADQTPFVVTVKNAAGGLLEGAAVKVDGGAALGTTLGNTDAQGQFKIAALPVGDYQVSASLDNHTAPAPAKATVKPAANNAATVVLTPDAITADITPTPLRVVVKKNICTPARKKVVLQTKGPAFKGKGKLSISKPTLKFFDKADKTGKEITGASELDGAALSAGLTLFAEAVSASASADDTELTLELFVGKNKLGAKGTAKATAVELTLDLFGARPEAGKDPAVLDEKTRTTVGRFVHLQDGANHHSRAMAVVRETKPDVGATLELHVVKSGAGDAKAFDAETGGAASALKVGPAEFKAAKQIGASKGVPVFVEGSAVSNGLRDLFLQVGLLGDEPDGDRALFTVFKITKIEASLQNTKCRRTGVRAAASKVNSVTDRAAFAAADPAAVKECGDLDFVATVAPAATPLTWIAVQAKDDAGPKKTPTVTENKADAKKMKLAADAEGSFTIHAFVDQKGDAKKRAPAESGMSLNLHMVNCEVQTGAADTKMVTTDLRTGTPAGGSLSVSTGNNPLPGAGYGDGQLVLFAFGMKVTVKVTGGGPDRLRGLARMGMGYIQDVVADNVTATYADGKTEKEVLAQLPLPVGVGVGGVVTAGPLPLLAFPVRDHRDPGARGYHCFINGSDDSDRTDIVPAPGKKAGQTWRLRMLDSPAIGVTLRHPVSNSPIAALAGTNDFHVWTVAFSQDFDENFTVLVEGTWSADYGSFNAGAGGWQKTGSITKGGPTVHTPPKKADDTGVEHCPPAYTETFVMDAR
jgi:outer membrane protein OmpA-like peptidoglycan-associated protein